MSTQEQIKEYLDKNKIKIVSPTSLEYLGQPLDISTIIQYFKVSYHQMQIIIGKLYIKQQKETDVQAKGSQAILDMASARGYSYNNIEGKWYDNSGLEANVLNLKKILKLDVVDNKSSLNINSSDVDTIMDGFDSVFQENIIDIIRKRVQSDYVEKRSVDQILDCEDDFIDSHIRELYEAYRPFEEYMMFKMAHLHFLWNMKRKILCQDVASPIIISYLGKQGIGKSSFFGCWYKNLICDNTKKINAKSLNFSHHDYYTSCSLSHLTDPKVFIIASKFLIDITEPGKTLDENQKTYLKDFVTNSHVTGRILRTTNNTTIKNDASMFATTNVSMASVLADSTGSRRLIEFTSSLPDNVKISTYKAESLGEIAGKTKTDIITDINLDIFSRSIKLMQMIDTVNIRSGFMFTGSKHDEVISKATASYVVLKEYQQFIQHELIFDEDERTSEEDLYKMYQDWACNTQLRDKLVTIEKFKVELRMRHTNEFKLTKGYKRYQLAPKDRSLRVHLSKNIGQHPKNPIFVQPTPYVQTPAQDNFADIGGV